MVIIVRNRSFRLGLNAVRIITACSSNCRIQISRVISTSPVEAGVENVGTFWVGTPLCGKLQLRTGGVYRGRNTVDINVFHIIVAIVPVISIRTQRQVGVANHLEVALDVVDGLRGRVLGGALRERFHHLRGEAEGQQQ